MVDSIVLAFCCLHNLLCTNNDFEPDTSSFNTVNLGLIDVGPLRRNTTQRAFYVREQFEEYFNSPDGELKHAMIWRGRNMQTQDDHNN
jgi:tricorn protease-like protein